MKYIINYGGVNLAETTRSSLTTPIQSKKYDTFNKKQVLGRIQQLVIGEVLEYNHQKFLLLSISGIKYKIGNGTEIIEVNKSDPNIRKIPQNDTEIDSIIKIFCDNILKNIHELYELSKYNKKNQLQISSKLIYFFDFVEKFYEKVNSTFYSKFTNVDGPIVELGTTTLGDSKDFDF